MSTNKKNSSKHKKSALTLAEVSVVFMILGIVAAIVVPTLISNYKERTTISMVKKTYSQINQAVLMSIKDNGYPNQWRVDDGADANSATQFAAYITPYLQISKDCGTQIGCLGYTTTPKLLKGTVYQNYDTLEGYYKLILSDGRYIWIRGTAHYCSTSGGGHYDTCGAVFVDTNGTLPPNVIGEDIFGFYITTNGVRAHTSASTCTKSGTGWGCLSYILQNNNMNYLHK